MIFFFKKIQRMDSESSTTVHQSDEPVLDDVDVEQTVRAGDTDKQSIRTDVSTISKKSNNVKEKRPRSEKQIAAFKRMAQAREEKRKMDKLEKERKPEKDIEQKKSLEMATAMFMEMRQKEKENKKDKKWENELNSIVTKRMDEFEDRMMNLLNQPVEAYVEKKRRKTSKNVEKSTPAETSSSAIKTPTTTPSKRYVANNPFMRK
jgi:hypothetical protein